MSQVVTCPRDTEEADAVDEDDLLQRLLDSFDYPRWTIVCRSMMIRIVRGEIDGAVDGLRRFAKQSLRAIATLDSPVAAVFPVRTANYLEGGGYFDLRSVALESDDTLLEIDNFGELGLAQVRSTIERVLEGNVLETYGQDEVFIDEELCVRRLPPPRTCYCERDHAMTNEEKVLDALELLAGSPDTAAEVLDKKIATLQEEVNRLKHLRAMLTKATGSNAGAKGKSFELTPDRKLIADRMVQHLTKTGPQKAGLLAASLGVSPLIVGKIAKADARLSAGVGRIALAG